jgi:6-phosphogluconolactonase
MSMPLPGRPALRVFATAEEVSVAAASLVADGLAAAIAARGIAHWATTGGSAAPGLYRALLAPDLRARVDWSRVRVWWGDDRFVPAGDPLSNVTPFLDVALAGAGGAAGASGLPIDPTHVYPIPVGDMVARGLGPAEAAAAYAERLQELGPWSAGQTGDATPAFDVIVVGVGPDGHLLSVFPGSAVWDAAALVTAAPAPTHIEPHVARVTMHPRVLAAARSVLVVTAGASKADRLGEAWAAPDGSVRDLPVRAAMGANAIWLLDEAAAAKLPRA